MRFDRSIMMSLTWLPTVRGQGFKKAARRRGPLSKLCVEALERRNLLSATTVTVSTTVDLVNGDIASISALIADQGPDGISLREAVMAANNTPSSEDAHNVIIVPAGTYDLSLTTTPLGDEADLFVGSHANLFTDIVGAGPATTVIRQTYFY